jgi:dethiobiotin synthetase
MTPPLVVVVAGTGTDVGKTWATCRLAEELRGRGTAVAARKPAQSFEPGTPEEGTDAGLLARSTGEKATDVCPPHRWYGRALAPPMAAASMGAPAPRLEELAQETTWPAGAAVGLVELAGGVGSPQAADGDGAQLAALLGPGLIVLVSRSGLGAIGEARLCARALPSAVPLVVFLNRYQADDEVHQANRRWLEENDGLTCLTGIPPLADVVLSADRH